MSRRLLILGALIALNDGRSLASPEPGRNLGTASAKTPAPYRSDVRVAHIEHTLKAVAEAPPALLQQGVDYARNLAHGACSAGAQRLRVECLMVAVQRYCRDLGGADAGRCPLYMDIVVSNALADEHLIPLERRYQIVQANADYRAALAAELRRIQGSLAVDFRLATGEARGSGELAANIDRYCQSTADDTKFAYQTCVSSLVWFIEETSAGVSRQTK